MTAIRSLASEVPATLSVVTDAITPLRSALTALAQAPIGVAIFDLDMRYLAASERFLTDQGLAPDTPLAGRVHYEVFPEIPQRWRDLHARAMKGEALSHEADPFIRDTGEIEWIRWSLSPWRQHSGEIGGVVLYTEFVTEAVKARQALEADEARYRAVFDHAAIGVARVAPDGRFLEVNDGFCEITRRSRADLLSLSAAEITHADDLPENRDRVQALLTGESATYNLEKRYLTADGAPVWVRVTCSLVRTASGEPDYFVSIVEDIGFRKIAEREQQLHEEKLRLMINELNHRVKNTLATVQSMAAQTMRSAEGREAAYLAFEARLMGLSHVHDVLTREHWAGASLSEVVPRALRPFSDASQGRVHIEGPDVWLHPSLALNIALILHELATNAVKYGALANGAGIISLVWTHDAETAMLRLTWTERGGPTVAPPTRRGFGSRLISRGFKGEVDGSTEVRFDPQGLVCVMAARLLDYDPIAM